MTNLRQAAQQALDALEWAWGGNELTGKEMVAIAALRAALAEPEQEPVAWMMVNETHKLPPELYWEPQQWHITWEAVPLYTAPTPRKPQTTHWEGCEAVHPECKERVTDRELLIRLAREAGFLPEANPVMPQLLERFAALVAAHEREECAKVCDEYNDGRYANTADLCAAAIRSRT